MKKSCFLWFHNWSKWSEIKNKYPNNCPVYLGVQHRVCNVCGKMDERIV